MIRDVWNKNKESYEEISEQLNAFKVQLEDIDQMQSQDRLPYPSLSLVSF